MHDVLIAARLEPSATVAATAGRLKTPAAYEADSLVVYPSAGIKDDVLFGSLSLQWNTLRGSQLSIFFSLDSYLS